MEINQQEEGRPPPWGWSAPPKKECPQCPEIVYYGSSYTTHNTEDGHHEQKKLYHKKGRRRPSNVRNAKDPRPGISLRKFAKIHNISLETWRREYARGAAHKPIRNGNKWIYAQYDAVQAQMSINERKSNMGTKMKLTMPMAIIFRYYVLIQRRSPYDARQYVIEALRGRDVPCLRTFYNHIESGDMGIFHGDTPYHPGKGEGRGFQLIPRRHFPDVDNLRIGLKRQMNARNSGTSRWIRLYPEVDIEEAYS